MAIGSTSNPNQPSLPTPPVVVPPALIRAAAELGLNRDCFKDAYVAWHAIYTSTGVDPNDAPRLAAERAISQLTADAAQQRHQLTP